MSGDKTKLFFLVIFPIILFDQITKAVVFSRFENYSCNKGIAFGLLPDFFGPVFYFVILAILGVLFLRQKSKVSAVGFLMVIAGGSSNLLDRIFRQCVLDFLNFGIWPSFNFADSMISVGVALILINILFKNRRSEK